MIAGKKVAASRIDNWYHSRAPIAKNPNRVYPDIAEKLAEEFAERIALVSDSESMTFRQYNNRANQYARWAAEHGIEKGAANR